jgi:hypothetical protein
MAAIDDYLINLSNQLVDIKNRLINFRRKKRLFNLLGFVIVAGSTIISLNLFFSSVTFNGVDYFILFYVLFFLVGLSLVFGEWLSKLFIRNYPEYSKLEIEKKLLVERIDVAKSAMNIIARIERVQSLIKRSIDRTNLSEFRRSLENITFANSNRAQFDADMFICKKILNRIEYYPFKKKSIHFKNKSRISTYTGTELEVQNEVTAINSPVVPVELTQNTPKAENVVEVPKIQTIPEVTLKVEKKITSIPILSSLFSADKPNIQDRNIDNVRAISPAPTIKKDFRKFSENNQELGLQGELYVIERERESLITNNRQDLANKIEHASKSDGDHLGYDVISYDEFGNEKFIEVKTTEYGLGSSFFLTDNELYTLNQIGNYFIYRVYNFNLLEKTGSIYVIDFMKGDLVTYFNLEPILFRVLPHKL